MKVAIVSFYYDESLRMEEELLEQHCTITGWAEALEKRSIDVVVINRFYKDSSISKNNVRYLFFKDSFGGAFKTWQIPYRFLKKISALNADIVHLHHLVLSPQTLLLRLLLKKNAAIIVQHHGGVSPGKFKRTFHNRINQAADGFFFTTTDQGKEWFNYKKQVSKVLPVMEGATFFNYADRDKSKTNNYYDRREAREVTGIDGAPVFLWVGRLDDNKDPLTILNGFKMLLKDYKEATLYMIYSDARLLGRVNEKCKDDEILNRNVHLLGKIAHERMEMYYNSADYFVLGSHYEGSGYSLSEALRCGCVPVVTDIPSFRMMTNNGQLGSLWSAGNSESFAAAIKKALDKPLLNEARGCIDFFTKNLSFDAIADRAMSHYQTVINRRLKINV